MTLDDLQERFGIVAPARESLGALWLDHGPAGVREVARTMNEAGARFVTITAYQLPGTEGFALEYHWDLKGRLLGFAYTITSKEIDSIFDLCEGADWIEREIHEEYTIDFTGRNYEPLLLRAEDSPGVNLREEVKR